MDRGNCVAPGRSWQADFSGTRPIRAPSADSSRSWLDPICPDRGLPAWWQRESSFPPRRALVCVACATRAPPWKTL